MGVFLYFPFFLPPPLFTPFSSYPSFESWKKALIVIQLPLD